MEHQLTSNPTPTVASNTIPPPYSTAVSIGACTWVIYPDAYDVYKGLVSFRSCNNFATSVKQWIIDGYNPNMTLNYDPDLLAGKRVSFLFQNTNDVVYGATYVIGSTPELGQVSVFDWFPAATQMRAILRGKATVR